MVTADDNTLLAAVVARSWPDLAPLAGPDRDAFEALALAHLRVIEAAGPGDAEAHAFLLALRAYPDPLRRIMQELADADLVLRGRPGEIPGAVRHERFLEIPVLYATDRAPTGRTDPFFGGRQGPMAYGVARVSVPDDHRMGRLEKPKLWRLEFRPDPAKHVTLLGLEDVGDGFTARAAGAVAAASTPDALIFVHGFSVDFADAVRRAAQIAYDLNFDGVPMLYSWPSQGSALRYTVDEGNIDAAKWNFAPFLRLVLGGIGARRVHLLAHSMGNRLVTWALADLGADESRRLGQIIFAAPDVAATEFTRLAARFVHRAERYTLYASSADRALQLSSGLVGGYPRAGQAGDGIVVVDGVDTIDASGLDGDTLGHSYYGDHRSVLSDVFALIRDGAAPGGRFGLRPAPADGGYWIFNP